MYGWRARIGLMTTSVNTVNEPEFYQLAPEGVSISTTRLRFMGKANLETTIEMNEDIERCANYIETANPDVVVYGVTAGSFFKGREYDTQLEAEIEEITGVPSITASSAIRRALAHLDVESVAIATPYIDEFNRRLSEYLEESGVSVAAMDGLGITEGFNIGMVSPQEMYREVQEIDHPDAEAVVVSGTNYRTIEVIEELEADLGKPVVSANAAAMWNALFALDVDYTDVECGRLFGAE